MPTATENSLDTQLARYKELLPADVLSKLQSKSDKGSLSQSDVIDIIGHQATRLIAFAKAAEENQDIVEGAPDEIRKSFADVLKHVRATAPAIIDGPALRTIVDKFATVKEQLPFDDIDSVGATPTYIGNSTSLTPVLRTEIRYTNRKTLGPTHLRMSDVAFLVAGLLESLSVVLVECGKFQKAGMLEVGELSAVSKQTEDIRQLLDRVEASLKEASIT